MFLVTYYNPEHGVGWLPRRLEPEDFLAGIYGSLSDVRHHIQRVMRHRWVGIGGIEEGSPEVGISIALGNLQSREYPETAPIYRGPYDVGAAKYLRSGNVFRLTGVPEGYGSAGPYIIYDLDG